MRPACEAVNLEILAWLQGPQCPGASRALSEISAEFWAGSLAQEVTRVHVYAVTLLGTCLGD